MNVKKIVSLLVSIVLGASVFAVSSYAIDSDQAQQNGEILAILMTVDNNEIAIAKETLTKEMTPAIKKYAEMLEKQHTQNLNKAMEVSKKTGIAPVDTETVKSLQQDGAKGLATLSGLNGKEFDNAFINAMVSGHTAVLKMIDDTLLTNASNPAIKKFVQETRPHIAFHLKAGEVIQKDMNDESKSSQ